MADCTGTCIGQCLGSCKMTAKGGVINPSETGHGSDSIHTVITN